MNLHRLLEARAPAGSPVRGVLEHVRRCFREHGPVTDPVGRCAALFEPGVRRALLASWLAASSAANAEVTAKDAWVRGTVPAQTSTGAFVTLTSTTEAKIVSVASPAAKTAEIHESMTHGGVNHMHAVESVALPAGRPVQLKPGGHHVMLMGLAQPLKPGDNVPLTFTIEEKGGKRTRLEVKAEVRPLGSR